MHSNSRESKAFHIKACPPDFPHFLINRSLAIMQFSKHALLVAAALSSIHGAFAQQVTVTFGQVGNDIFVEWSGTITQFPIGRTAADLNPTSGMPGVESFSGDIIAVYSAEFGPARMDVTPANGVTFSGGYRRHDGVEFSPDVQGGEYQPRVRVRWSSSFAHYFANMRMYIIPFKLITLTQLAWQVALLILDSSCSKRDTFLVLQSKDASSIETRILPVPTCLMGRL